MVSRSTDSIGSSPLKLRRSLSMSFAPRLCWWLLALSLSINNLFQPTAIASAIQNPADETALRALAENFFNTWSAKDLDGFLRLWSARAPELAAREKSTRELFAGSAKLEVSALAARKIKLDGT